MEIRVITTRYLAETTLNLLAAEEVFLRGLNGTRSSRQYREYDIQFLLWRELVALGYDAWMEEKKIDIAIRDGSTLAEAIEIKGPWRASDVCSQSGRIDEVAKDYKKHLKLLTAGRTSCFGVWILHGADESTISQAFGILLDTALPGNGIWVEPFISQTMVLNRHPKSKSRVQSVCAAQVRLI